LPKTTVFCPDSAEPVGIALAGIDVALPHVKGLEDVTVHVDRAGMLESGSCFMLATRPPGGI
jgi:hypothetical protein